ncbi:MAG TPA: hypothetical protein PLX08_03380 [Bacteroidales bacterium]|jgi:hypothetical protein|nr:hypothetical protein [Bacteroidales bacterium]
MNKLIISLMTLCLASFSSVAQDITFPALKGYKIRTDYPVYVRENLWDFIDGAADNYLAYGFIDVHVAEYKKGRAVIKAEIYRHSDNTMAFGIYSSERSPSFRFVNLGSQGYIADGAINFFKGNYYVKIKTYSKKEKVLHEEENLAARIAAMLQGEAAMPPMLSLFPSDGLKKNEEVYINESILGHSFLNRGFKASYQVGNDVFSIFIIESNSADDARKTAETYIASTGISPVETADNKFVLTDGYNGSIFLAWKDRKIVIISGLAKDQSDIADRYTSEILK